MRTKPQDNQELIENKHWFAIYTYFRREKTAVKELQLKGVECFIPLVSKSRKYDRKIKHFNTPLINHYVFVRIDKREVSKVLGCRDVIKFIKLGSEANIIPEKEIEILKRINRDPALLEAKTSRPKRIGEHVEIISGNLAGLKGRLIKVKNKDQVMIDLNHIGYSIELEVSLSNLSITDKSAQSEF